MAYLSALEIKKLGFKSYGKSLQISSKASFYNANQISIGDYSRIDDYCVISSGIKGIHIGNNVHISVQCSIIGKGMVRIGNYSAISVKTSIFSSSDDYSGEYMTNPTIPAIYTNVKNEDVIIGNHVIIGANSVVLPGVVIEDGVAIGALSLVKTNCKEFCIYAGAPAQFLKLRSKKLLMFEKQLAEQEIIKQ